MRKYIKYILILVCVAILMVGQYWYLTKDDLSKSVFSDSSLSANGIYKDVSLQMAKELMVWKANYLPEYNFSDYRFSMSITEMDPLLTKDFSDGAWVRISYSYTDTYKLNPQKDPYILGMKEVLKETEDSEVKAVIQDFIQDGIFWREDMAKNPQEVWATAYAFFEYDENRVYPYGTSHKPYGFSLKNFEFYFLYKYDGEENLIPFSEYYPARDAEENKQHGRQAAEALAAQVLASRPTPFAFAVVDEIPTVLYADSVYQYGTSIDRDFSEDAAATSANGNLSEDPAMASSAWTPLKNVTDATRLFSGEYLGYLDAAGKLHYETYFEEIALAMEEGKQLSTLAYYYHDLAKQALEINEKEPFVAVNGPINSDFRALLQDGSVIYYDFHEFKHYKPQEEIRKLVGPFLLTASGNVYMLYMDNSSPLSSERKVICDLVYGGGNITDISGSAKGFVGLTAEGKAVTWVSEWWKEQHALPDLSDWENLKEVILGDSGLVAGLTVDGKVICRHVDENITQKLQTILKDWGDTDDEEAGTGGEGTEIHDAESDTDGEGSGIVAIEEYHQKLYAIDKDGNCYGVDFSPVLEDTEAECILLEF